MGGSGSTRWDGHRKRTSVESCHRLEVLPGGKIQGRFPVGQWAMEYEQTPDGGPRWLVVKGNRDGWLFEDRIEVVTWKPRFGGRSMWLLCRICGRNTRKLFAPPGKAMFRCRKCWGLAYESSQMAHRWDRGWVAVMMSIATGLPLRELEKQMRAEYKADRIEERGW